MKFSDEIVTAENGGKQSRLDYRFDLLDPKAMFRLAEILDYGAKRYGDNNWRKLPQSDHINHALAHIFALQNNDHQEDHLGHAFCRLMFALGVSWEKDIVIQQHITINNAPSKIPYSQNP